MDEGLSSITRAGCTERTLYGPARRAPVRVERRSRVVAWVACLDRLRRRRAERLEDAALFVVVHEPGGSSRLRVRERFASPSSREPLALSLGRHPGCDLPGMREASLRHALVLAWPRHSRPLEVVDLRSNTGLVVSSGRVVRHLRGHGPLRFVAGNDDVTVLFAPPGAPLEVDLPDELDGWIAIEERRMLGELDDLADEPSRVAKTSASFVMRVDDRLVRVADRRPLDARAHEVIAVSPRHLRRGVLLGRYERCDESAYFRDDETVSRVHALALERGGALHVVDVGSTHGTSVVDAREDRELARLDARRRVVTLGDDEVVRLGSKRVVFEVRGSDAQ